MNTERLLMLATFLDQLPPNALNMNHWWSDLEQEECVGMTTVDRLPSPVLNDDGIVIQPPVPVTTARDCGFAACAIGWACMMPEFHNFGLTLTDDQFDSTSGYVGLAPSYRGYYGFPAISHFFSISVFEAQHLFSSNAYDILQPMPNIVANRIRLFCC